MINRKTRKIDIVVNWIIILIALFVGDEIFLFSTIDSEIMHSIKDYAQIGLFVFFVLLYFFSRRSIKSRSSFIIVLIMSGFVILSMIYNRDFRLGYLVMIMVFFIAFFLIDFYGTAKIFFVLYKSMLFICLFSIVVFGFSLLFPSILSLAPVVRNVNGVEFYCFGLSNVPLNQGGFVRNYGPFREPGVFQMFIVVSLIYALFIKREKKYLKIIILIVALLTTFSTTGYISFFFIILAIVFSQRTISPRVKWITFSFALISIIYLGYKGLLYKEGYGSVFGKLFGTYYSISSIARKASIWINLKMFMKNPIIGTGLSYVENMFPILTQETYNLYTRDNTNTFLIQLARFGIPFSLLFFERLFRFSFQLIKDNFIACSFVFGSLFLLLFGENLTYSFLIYFLLFGKKIEEEKNENSVVCKYCPCENC